MRGSLTGPIPTTLRSLKQLEYLDLWDNNLQGSVPAWLGELSKLAFLSLGRNALGGTLPDALCRLGSLRMLLLSHMQVELIPSLWLTLSCMTEHGFDLAFVFVFALSWKASSPTVWTSCPSSSTSGCASTDLAVDSRAHCVGRPSTPLSSRS